MKIAHIADIHILALHRHDEHREALSFVAKECKKLDVDIILIGGDVWHTKTIGISPEYIDLLSNSLLELSKVAPVHIFLGNHDFNVTNKNRQDAISPIVNALNNRKIKLYKNSGVYNIYPKVNLCVFSIYDEENWNIVKPISGDYNIACYHGAVKNAATDTGWISDSNIDVEMFEPFQLGLLGDLHTSQFLGYRDYALDDGSTVSRPWIGYCGSLLQNNYGETGDKGFLVWDIKLDKKFHDVSFIKVPAKHEYITVDWQGSIEETIQAVSQLSEGLRVRIKSDEALSYANTNALQQLLQQQCAAHEVTFKVDSTKHKNDIDTIKIDGKSMHRNDIRNFDTLFGLLKDYYSNIDQSEFVAMEKILKKYMNQTCTEDDVPRGVTWSVDNMKFDNVLAYGEDNNIDFSKLNSLVGLFGPNKIGKSSFICSLLYTLFNVTDRGTIPACDMINNNKNSCYSSVNFSVDSKKYFIERQSIKTVDKKGVHSSTSVNLFNVDEQGVRSDLNAEQRKDTEKVIRKLIGTVDDFTLLNVSVQDGMKDFIYEGPTARKTLVSRILDIDYFDKLYDLAKDDVNSLKSNVKLFAKRDWNTEIEELNKKSIEIEGLLKDINSKIEQKEHSIKCFHEELGTLKTTTNSVEEINKIRVELDKLENQKTSIINRKLATINKKEETKVRLASLDDMEDASINVDELKKKLEECRKLECEYNSNNNKLSIEKQKLATQERSLLKLLDVPCGDQFPGCKYIKDSHKDKKSIEKQKSLVAELNKKVEAVLSELNVLNNLQISKRIDRIEKVKNARRLVSEAIIRCDSELELVGREEELNDTATNSYTIRLGELESSVDETKQERIIELKSLLNKINSELKTLEFDRVRLERDIGSTSNKLETTTKEQKEHKERLTEYRTYELLSAALSKKGLPSKVLKSQLPIVNSEIANILSGVLNFNITLELDEALNTLNIFLNDEKSKRRIEVCSGMEKVIASLAIKVALRNVSTLPQLDMLILDEGFSDLDEAGVEACSALLKSLKRYYKSVIIVTHIEALKDVVDDTIEISRVDGYTRLNYV
jgi:DNA repair exonuclease SbcCD ATPase subunit/DNA repair exonuclease SbcCD nuclease subunit